MNVEKERLASVGRNLATLREYRRLTQAQVAERCGVSRNYIGQVEAGERNPTLGVIFNICDALQCYADINFTPKE